MTDSKDTQGPAAEHDHIARLADALIDLRIPNPLRAGAAHDIEVSGVYDWDELQRLAAALTPLLEQAQADVARQFVRWATANQGAGSTEVVDWSWFARIAREHDPTYADTFFPPQQS